MNLRNLGLMTCAAASAALLCAGAADPAGYISSAPKLTGGTHVAGNSFAAELTIKHGTFTKWGGGGGGMGPAVDMGEPVALTNLVVYYSVTNHLPANATTQQKQDWIGGAETVEVPPLPKEPDEVATSKVELAPLYSGTTSATVTFLLLGAYGTQVSDVGEAIPLQVQMDADPGIPSAVSHLEAVANGGKVTVTFMDAKDDGGGPGNHPVHHYEGWTVSPGGANVPLANLPSPQAPGTDETFTFQSPVEGMLKGFVVPVDECGQEGPSESFTTFIVPDAGSDSDSGLRSVGCHARGAAGIAILMMTLVASFVIRPS